MKRHTTKPSAIRTLPHERLAAITGGGDGNVKGANVEHATLSASPTGIGRA